MLQLSFGDLATSYRSQLNNTRLKAEMQRLSTELATGKTSDLRAVLGGDLGNYAGIENALNGLSAYKVANSEAKLFTETLQNSLASIQNSTSEIAPALLLAGSSNEATLVQSAAADARSRFASVVSVLNTKIADRAILAGTATGSDALANSETMLAELQTAIATETTAAGVETVVEAWFDDLGGGFETSGYLGDTTNLDPFRISQNEQADLSFRADDQNLRDLMKGYAMAALVADGALSGSHEERVLLTGTAATRLLSSDYDLAQMRAGIGSLEGKIDTTKARNNAERAALEITRSELVAVDPYQAATELQAAETQLQMLYAITARLSRLSLAEYL